MNEFEYHQRADLILNNILNVLEEADEKGTLDVECQGGVLTILLPSGQQYIVNKHTASKQIWMSSPLSGGSHFSYDEARSAWALADGRTLNAILAREMELQADIKVTI